MNVKQTMEVVMLMQIVKILKEVLNAVVIMDIQGMDLIVQAWESILFSI